MPDRNWIAIGRDAGGFRTFAIEGARVTAEARADREDAAFERLDFTAEVIHRIGEGTSDTTPCAVLPVAGRSLPVVTQDQPADVLGAWPRLWIAGFLKQHENWDGVICVEDGDVTHWVHVSADEIVSFASFLTLRLIAALGGVQTPDADAMADSQSRPERLARHLREAEITARPDAITGHLIGAELAAARVYWLGQQVAVIAPAGEAAPHAIALAAQGVPATYHRPDVLLWDGLVRWGQALGMVTDT